MSNPVLVEVKRGGQIESRHSGAVAVIDADGGVVLELGDIDAPVYPRSAVKAFQALPLIESGAADHWHLSEAEIALACSSHSGEPVHTAAANAMLHKAGRAVTALECGAHWPMGEASARALAGAGALPSALHNNCSGKHAGFVCLSCHLEADPAHYIEADHIVQRLAKAAMESICMAGLTDEWRGVDGCSIPAYAAPLRNWARGFARFGSGHGLGASRAKAALRIRASVAAHPHMVAGTGRFDTDVMQALGARAFTKTGAEGVFCAALPELGLGVALKCDDGAGRAAETMMAEIIGRFLTLSDGEAARLDKWRQRKLTNWNGIEVGGICAVAPLAPGNPLPIGERAG